MSRPGTVSLRVTTATAAAVALFTFTVGLAQGQPQSDNGLERSEARSSTSSKVKKCKKIKDSAKRRECILIARGSTTTVMIGDNYYAPSTLEIRPYDTLLWNWRDSRSSEGHDVGLESGPPGIGPSEFASRVYTGPGGRFKRTFKKPGTYRFICSLHYEMQMQVTVRK